MMRSIFVAFVSCGIFDPTVGAPTPDLADGDQIIFSRDIRPLMNRTADDRSGHGCAACHYSTNPDHPAIDQIGLDLATLGALRKGGAHTQSNIVVPGNPASSAIVRKLRGTQLRGARMPKNGPPFWSEHDIQIVERWIAEGAKGADDE